MFQIKASFDVEKADALLFGQRKDMLFVDDMMQHQRCVRICPSGRAQGPGPEPTYVMLVGDCFQMAALADGGLCGEQAEPAARRILHAAHVEGRPQYR
jgi:hypothetical protein